MKCLKKDANIRNSTVDFLIFTKQNNEDSIEVRVQDENVWLTQSAISQLFDKGRSTITEHLKNIFVEGELNESAVCREFRHTATDGKEYATKYYGLDAIISVGYRVNSKRATQFRQWATKILKDYTIKGYVLDKQRLKNGQIFDEEYFEYLLDEIREIRASERRFYQKITDIYATAMDYSPNAVISKEFFAIVQNKLHFAIHGSTAAEVIVNRADHEKEHMGLTTWKNAPNGKIVKADVSIAKNYLSVLELKDLNHFVSMYLDYAERQARKQIPMTMEDWANKLNVFLNMNDEKILSNADSISHEIAKSFAESEFEQYRILQDKIFESDFDRTIKELKV